MADKDSTDCSAGSPDPEEKVKAPVRLELESPSSAPPNYSLDSSVPPALIAFALWLLVLADMTTSEILALEWPLFRCR